VYKEGGMFLILIFFICSYLYGADAESTKDKMPVSLLEPIRLVRFESVGYETDSVDTSITSSAGISLDEEATSSDEEIDDDDDYASYGMQRSPDSVLFDGMDLTGMVPLHADEISSKVNKEIPLRPKRTQLEIQKDVLLMREYVKNRSIKILMLKITEPKKY